MDDPVYRFMKLSDDDTEANCHNLAEDPRLALLACCIADQQRAGFGSTLDLRQFPCPLCKEPGFNTGYGFWQHTCGAEVMSSGEIDVPCKGPPAAQPVT